MGKIMRLEKPGERWNLVLDQVVGWVVKGANEFSGQPETLIIHLRSGEKIIVPYDQSLEDELTAWVEGSVPPVKQRKKEAGQ